LSLIDQHEENDHRHTDPPLKCCERAEGPDARTMKFISIEIPVRDPHDLTDRARLRHHVNDDGKNRRRERQRFGWQVLRVTSGPKPGPTANTAKPNAIVSVEKMTTNILRKLDIPSSGR
jgi:hypothetical protein